MEHLKFHGQLRFAIFRGLPDQLLVRRKSLKNVAAIQMEDITPAAISSSSLLAPEEILDKINWGNGFYRKDIGFRIIDK